MEDIGIALENIMQKEKCSGIHAFFLLTDTEGDKYGLCKLQSKSCKETGWGLRDKSRVQNNR